MAQIDHANRIHLIGIGGCSMNGLALILQSQGHKVSGSDRERTQFTDALDAAGIPFIKLGIDQQMRDFGQAATAIQAFADVLSVQ